MNSAGADNEQRRRTLYVCLGLVALTLAVFWPILGHDFVNFDDNLLIRENADFNPPTLDKVIRYWDGPYYGGAFPLTYTFLAAIAAAARDADGTIQPGPFHAVSVALHAACTVIVFLLVRKLVGRELPALIGAGLFAVHPLQVEAVAWATNLNTLLYGLFSLLALWLYILFALRAKDAAPSDRRARMMFIAATVAFVLAMLSKPVAVTLPIAAAALDAGFVGRRWREVVRPTALWLILAAPVMVATRLLLPAPEIFAPPLWARPLVAMDALAFYLAKLVAPVGLNIDYGRTPRWLLSSPAIYLTWLAPAAVAVLLLLVRRWAAPIVAAAALFVASLLPVLGLTPFHFQQYSTVADRYLYVSMLGVTLVAAWLLARLPRGVSGGAVAVVVVFAVWSHVEVRQWRDTETLFRTSLRRNPTSLAAHNVLAYSASRRGDFASAIEHYSAALRTDPMHSATLYNLANLLRAGGRPGDAIPLYRQALVRAPRNPKMHNNLGVALAETGQLQLSDESFLNALKLDPRYVDALIGRGVVNRKLGRHDLSIASYERALAIDPENVLARRGLQQTRAQLQGMTPAATTAPGR